ADGMREIFSSASRRYVVLGSFTVQQPAANYADKRCDDEEIEQREIFENRRHGLLLLISSVWDNNIAGQRVPRLGRGVLRHAVARMKRLRDSFRWRLPSLESIRGGD
ncbi:hypothetical protein ACWGRJ_48500, partial [Bradyrhizobium sp. Lot11]